MEPIYATTVAAPSGGGASALSGAGSPNSFAEMGSADFLKLLITQLQYQDPLEPMGNAELLQQISSVREIELSTTLTDSLRVLTGQQNFASASSLIGKYVTAAPGEDGKSQSGIVAGVRFTDDGRSILQLANGGEMALEQVSRIEPPIGAAEALNGQVILGVDRRDRANPEFVEGLVTGVRAEGQDEVLLELDTGQSLRFRDVYDVTTGN